MGKVPFIRTESEKDVCFVERKKRFFYDSFCCWSLEFQKDISRKRSNKNCLKTSVQRKTDIWTMSPNEQLRLSRKNWGKVKSVTVSRCCHGYVDLENLSFFATQICTLQAGTVLFPTLFEAFLPVVFKYRRVRVVIDCSRPFIFPWDHRDRALCVFVPGPTTIDQKTMLTTLRKSMLRAAILHECQNYLGGGAVWEEARKIFFSPLPPPPPPPPTSYNPRRPPPRYIWKSTYPWR